jgi:8-oxo-dGTP pyrophosphatase MutT (NUDIX family)
MEMLDKLRTAIDARRARRLQIPGFRPAAVLVPVVQRAGEVLLAFTVRSPAMPTHSGQISFPGGVRQNGETEAAQTALREAAEELGIDPVSVGIAGEIDDVATPVGFVITPVVGRLVDPPPFAIDPREVDAVFEVTLGDLADPGHQTHKGEHVVGGRTYSLPEFHVAGRRIWGATARMVENLLEILAAGV